MVVELKIAFTSWKKVQFMMEKEEGIKEIFGNRGDRLLNSDYSYLIVVDGVEVGFINLVREKNNEDFYFLDMGIKKEYRNRGIGKKALEKLSKETIDKFIIGETKEENISANKSIENIGIKIDTVDGRNFYLFQRDRLNEFIDNDYLERLGKHLEKSSNRRNIIQ